MISIKSEREIQLMKEAGRIVAETHELLKKNIKPGITTKELDEIAENYILSQGATPAFKGYGGFPASICASINHEVVHGIPGNKTLQEADIISIDIGTIKDQYYGDAARTYPVGNIDAEAQKPVSYTHLTLPTKRIV